MKLDGGEGGKWKDRTVRALAEIALGVRKRDDLVYWDMYREVGYEVYPVRRETGIERVTRNDTPASKLHLKSDNRDFLADLKQFIRDN